MDAGRELSDLSRVRVVNVVGKVDNASEPFLQCPQYPAGRPGSDKAGPQDAVNEPAELGITPKSMHEENPLNGPGVSGYCNFFEK
jgi:hypothetical protein